MPTPAATYGRIRQTTSKKALDLCSSGAPVVHAGLEVPAAVDGAVGEISAVTFVGAWCSGVRVTRAGK